MLLWYDILHVVAIVVNFDLPSSIDEFVHQVRNCGEIFTHKFLLYSWKSKRNYNSQGWATNFIYTCNEIRVTIMSDC